MEKRLGLLPSFPGNKMAMDLLGRGNGFPSYFTTQAPPCEH